VSGGVDVSSGPEPVPEVRLVELGRMAMAELAAGNRDTASAAAGVVLPAFFTSPDCTWLWRLRLDQLAAAPDGARWIARAAVDCGTGVVVGHAGFHGPPDESGMVEMGYAVDPRHRRRGYARAMVRELLRRAREEPEVATVRATISPGNVASLATIAGLGFVLVGRQDDEVDGLELVFERSV
jgi:[ribosomal protein S5]-alanine N-acetyltransferase